MMYLIIEFPLQHYRLENHYYKIYDYRDSDHNDTHVI